MLYGHQFEVWLLELTSNSEVWEFPEEQPHLYELTSSCSHHSTEVMVTSAEYCARECYCKHAHTRNTCKIVAL